MDLQALCRSAAGGDAAAREELFARLSRVLGQVARSRLRDPREQEEVVQDALAIVHEKLDGLDPARPILPFAFLVLRNRIGDRYRHAVAHQRRFVPETVDLERTAAAGAGPGDPEAAASSRELVARLRRACRKLGADERRILRLLIEGNGAAEVAEALAIKLGTARVRIHRLREKLKGLLEETDRGPQAICVGVLPVLIGCAI